MNINKIRLQKTLSRRKTLFTEVKQEFKRYQDNINKLFSIEEYISKDKCSSFLFGKEKIKQKCYICSICDKKGQNYICDYCYKTCHEKCRNNLKETPESLMEREYLDIKKFYCFCGVNLKHTFDKIENTRKMQCTMMQLDQILDIVPYHCISHNQIVCCICAVVCHEKCKKNKIEIVDNELGCECDSDFHSNFNEFALSFPLDKYKKYANIDIWPIQVLNILFSTKSTFTKMALFFKRCLNNEIDFNNIGSNVALINKFEILLEVFSDSFNRKFKSYYYVEEISEMFPFEKLFLLIKQFDVVNGQTAIIKFRLLFILLFIHLRRDFNSIKSFTSNDFYCNTVLERLIFKKVLKSDIIFTYEINDKYKLNEDDSEIKKFVLLSLCNLIRKGMNYVSVEENQDEFEIGLKLITFMLKRMIFNKNDIILLIDSIYDFHEYFYNYIMSEANNIYLLIDVFNTIVEICFIISVYYNDLIIEEYLKSKKVHKIGKFLHSKTEHSNKLLAILLKNCDLFSRHFDILIKPNLDIKGKEEIQREKTLRNHKLEMQNKNLNRKKGVNTKIPENGGLFTEKIINLFVENLSLFSLADNFYQKQINSITNEDINEYYFFCEKIEKEDLYEIMNIEPGIHHSNILYNLKVVIDEIYSDLFTTSYTKQKEEFETKIKTSLLNACDEIGNNIEKFKNKSIYKNSIIEFEKKEKKRKKNKNICILDDAEKLKRKILKEISFSINFSKDTFLLIKEGRELLVDNLIISQIDEILFKGLFFLSNIHYPNLISSETIKLFFQFLSLFLLTERGIKYIITGKSLQVIQRLINRFRYDENNKNVNEEKNRTKDFNINSIKEVIHFLNYLTELIKIYDIKAIKGHKAIMKYRKSLITHLKYFSKDANTEKKEFEFKKQLKESLEIFNNLFSFYSYNDFENIKTDVIDLFKNSHFKFLNLELFQNLFDKSIYDNEEINIKIRNCEIEYYFQFFELVTKNSFYIYNNDEYGKKLIDSILEFIDIEALEKILFDSSDIITYEQKTILLKFVRTYYFIDYLDQINYLKKADHLSKKDYKYMIKNNLIKDKQIVQYLNIDDHDNKKKNKSKNSIGNVSSNKRKKKEESKKYIKKYEYIKDVIILLNIYGEEIDKFPYSINNETNINIKNYIKELIFAVHEISNFIYYNKSIANLILPYYYKLSVKFLNRKDIFIKILVDISNNKQKINPNEYEYLILNENKNNDYKFIAKHKFIIFDKIELFNRIIKNIYDIYIKTKINEEYSLKRYLEIYDVFNEANFPPFSLLEVKDYEYFYEGQDDFKENGNDEENPQINNIIKRQYIINKNYLEDFRNISTTSFLGVLTGDVTDKKFDFGLYFTELFESFINSSESGNLKLFRTLLCILNKMLFYDCFHVQSLFKEMIIDKHFFNNLNRELNYYIVQYIDSSKKYELCSICAEITDITKLTIQFLQLLGEGFNTDFHENILKELSERRRLLKKRTLLKKGTFFLKDMHKGEEDEYSDDKSITINDDLIEKSIKFTVRQELNKIKKIPLIEPEYSIYESLINNLKIIFNLMELNSMVEVELAFDKLCILSSNIIDFLIEYIDTTQSLVNIIDSNIINLFFSKEKKRGKKDGDISQKGIYKILSMKIKGNDNENNEAENGSQNESKSIYNKYKLRKIMLAYIKIKYYQLIRAYLQLGKKNEFIELLLEHKIGPIQLFEQVLYYMSELINNLINKDYKKYYKLLNVHSVNSYRHKLKRFYMYEEDFRTSIEISLIFQICTIIMILEDIYGITVLKEHYESELINSIIKSKNHKKIKNISLENIFSEEKFDEEEGEEEEEEEEEEESEESHNNYSLINNNKNENNEYNNNIVIKKNKEREEKKENNNIVTYNNFNITNNMTNNISNTLAPLKSKYLQSNINENIINLNSIKKNDKINDILTLKDNPHNNNNKKEEIKKKSLYYNIYKFYKKFILSKIKEEDLKKLSQKKRKLDENLLNINSKFSISVYKFIFSLIQKIGVKSEIDFFSNKIKKRINYKRLYLSKVSKEVSEKIINFKNIDFFLSNRNVNQDDESNEYKPKHINSNDDVKLLDEESEENKITFFIKPYLSFHLSERTKDYFINNVDRSSAKGKYKSLVLFSDYCLFEMMYNMKYINISKFLKKLSNISFYLIQVINYILIIAENILLIHHYYRPYSLDYEEYNKTEKKNLNKIYKDIVIIIVIKLIICIFSFIVWTYFKFILEFQRNIIFLEEKNFIFKEAGKAMQNINNPIIVKYFKGSGSLFKTMELINKNLGFFRKVKILVFDTILFNTDINIFIFSFLLNIFYLIFNHPLILSIEILFIVGIFPILLNILKSFYDKFYSLFICLILTFLIIYVYNWLVMFYMRDTINFENIIEYQSGQYITEHFCHSSIQCLLIMINYGTRCYAGISEILPMLSTKNNINMYLGRFIYDLTFFIIVTMIMGNVTLGLIVDNFGELRDEAYNYENDKNNICFICQLSRDGCLLKNIDFDEHIKKEHNLWNYVYFLIYLHLYNPNDFSRIEGLVWDKLPEKKYTWFPIDNSAGEDEDNSV